MLLCRFLHSIDAECPYRYFVPWTGGKTCSNTRKRGMDRLRKQRTIGLARPHGHWVAFFPIWFLQYVQASRVSRNRVLGCELVPSCYRLCCLGLELMSTVVVVLPLSAVLCEVGTSTGHGRHLTYYYHRYGSLEVTWET